MEKRVNRKINIKKVLFFIILILVLYFGIKYVLNVNTINSDSK